jgi:SAM-dependent methyltransferase
MVLRLRLLSLHMHSVAYRSARLCYRAGRTVAKHTGFAGWFSDWTSPLHITRTLLRDALRQRTNYARGWLLDVGCGEKPYRELFPQVERHIGVDSLGSTPDVYGDGMYLPFRDCSFETVLCNQVLEHVPEPWKLMDEAARVLKPEGCLILTAPQTWDLHHVPFDYYRYTCFGLKFLAERSGLEVVEVVPTCGIWATVAQRVTDTITNTYLNGGQSFLVRKLIPAALVPVQIAGYRLDKWCGKRGDTLDYVLIARKRPATADSAPVLTGTLGIGRERETNEPHDARF